MCRVAMRKAMGTVRGMHTNVHSNGSVFTRGTLRGSFLFFSCPRLKAGVRRSEEVGTSSSCVGRESLRIREVGARAGEGVFVSVKSDALPEAHYNGEQRVSAPLKNNSSNSHVVTDCFADEKHMMHALSVARTAFSLGEVPVGAVAVHSATGTVVATAHNETESLQDPTAHAEMLCMRRAAQSGHPLMADGWRSLRNVTLYVTLEPCAMCAGAILQARLGKVVYGARSKLLGAHGSWVSLLPSSARHFQENESVSAMSNSKSAQSSSSFFRPPTQRLGRERLPHSLSSVAASSQNRSLDKDEATMPARPHPFTPDVSVIGGVLAPECGELMRRFFRERSRGRTKASSE